MGAEIYRCSKLRKELYMLYYFIICRSLTYAQRTAFILEQKGIGTQVLRSPKSIAAEGCGYGVRVSQRNLIDALSTLRDAGQAPKKVYVILEEGDYREVEI